ncbi:hypothetical protein [Paludisphaera rhizosphaerae]|uniref:hypothetical protein n=1 Tax=Paludisphaera rhizosphaerae TaxID=2711216 RepID=UPI0013ED7391|nr:hypothetical protein [Paludisphaera rhizosphaerae]
MEISDGAGIEKMFGGRPSRPKRDGQTLNSGGTLDFQSRFDFGDFFGSAGFDEDFDD